MANKEAAKKPAKPKGTGVAAQPTASGGGAATGESGAKTHGFRRKLVGVVTGDKMSKTVTVEVVRRSIDPVYKKYVRTRDRYKAHDEKNEFKVGDKVEITEHRPISRDKRWLVTRLVTRRVEA